MNFNEMKLILIDLLFFWNSNLGRYPFRDPTIKVIKTNSIKFEKETNRVPRILS